MEKTKIKTNAKLSKLLLQDYKDYVWLLQFALNLIKIRIYLYRS